MPDKSKMKFMFWHSRHKPEPIEGVIMEEEKSNCTCGAKTHDYYIPKHLMKKWKKHCEETGFGW